MKNRSLNIIFTTVVLAISTLSCIPPSNETIQEIHQPDTKLIDNFNLKFDGQIIYQFYQEYGFTDLEEQLIMIVEPKSTNSLIHDLPFDSNQINELERIQTKYFFDKSFLNLKVKKETFSDILLEATEFHPLDTITFNSSKGKYLVQISDSVESLYVWDSKNNYLYIESNKKHNK